MLKPPVNAASFCVRALEQCFQAEAMCQRRCVRQSGQINCGPQTLFLLPGLGLCLFLTRAFLILCAKRRKLVVPLRGKGELLNFQAHFQSIGNFRISSSPLRGVGFTRVCLAKHLARRKLWTSTPGGDLNAGLVLPSSLYETVVLRTDLQMLFMQIIICIANCYLLTLT